MKPTEHSPNGYKVICKHTQNGHSAVCFNTHRYKVAKRYKDECTAREQRRKHKYRYYILPMSKKDKRVWRSLPF